MGVLTVIIWLASGTTNNRRVSCPHCRITLTPLRKLQASGRATLMPSSEFVRDSRGSYYAAPTVNKGEVAVFGPDGAFVKAIGRFGSGPGELSEVEAIALSPQDSLWVSDFSSRVSVFAPDGNFARSFQSPRLIVDLIPLRRAGEFLAAVSTQFGRRDPPVVLYKGSDVHAVIDFDQRDDPASYKIASEGDNLHVAAHTEAYTITRTSGARATTSFSAGPHWFDDTAEGARGPNGQIIDIALSGDSLLWVHYRNRHPTGVVERPKRTEQQEDRITTLAPDEMRTRNAFYLDAVDLAQERTIARGRVRNWLIAGFAGSDVIAARRNPDGEEEYWVLHVGIRR